MDEGSGPHRVIVTDFNMGFGNMVWFMVKWAIASIPAFLILMVLTAGVFGFFATLIGLGSVT